MIIQNKIFQSTSIINVSYAGGSQKISMGRLLLKDRQILFEYTTEFLKSGLELSPLKLPLQQGVIVCEDRLFDGLFGVFNDSLPDGWGRLLLDRKLMNTGINPGDLSPLDRLRYVGSRGMGALVYEPEIDGSPLHPHDDLFVEDLLFLNGSSAGARPKILVTIDGDEWIVKFRSPLDPKDSGPIEYVYHLMAKMAQMDVPEARLFPSKKGPGFFGVKRFDRVGGKRLHMHTVSGLLHVDHRVPSLDYGTIMKATLWLTKSIQDSEKQFRAAVFNVLAHNRDDHAKNFSFLMDKNAQWTMSPAYDLIFSSGPAGEHCTMIMGEGKSPEIDHLLKLAQVGGLKKKRALEIIDEVKKAVSQWEILAKEWGVSAKSSSMIQRTMERVQIEIGT